MSDGVEFRCFIGGLSWSTSDRALKEAFEKFGHLVEARVVVDKFSGRSRGFGFVTFDEKQAMEEAIEAMNGMDLDGRTITVDRAQANQSSGRGYDNDRPRDGGRERGREFGGGRGGDRGGGGGGGECFKCGKPGHFARECPSDGSKGGSRHGGGRDDRYGGGGSRGGVAVVVVVMVLIVVVIDMVGAIGRMVVVGEEVVVIDMVVIVLGLMIVEARGGSDLAE